MTHPPRPQNFALLGAGGFIAPRHIKAIKDTGNVLVAAADPSDSVGVLDRYFMDVRYFKEIERFDRHLEKRHRGPEVDRVQWVSICTPNYLHDAHCRLALRNGANALCEKPLVINPWNLDGLQTLEEETGRRVFTVLQLRVHPALLAVKERLRAAGGRHRVILTYVTGRGPWYHFSWKGAEDRSGGLATNIGIHFFDLLMWFFGGVEGIEVHAREPQRMAGALRLERADVQWFLSVDAGDLPFKPEPGVKTTHRSISVDGEEVEFTEGFTDLHTRVYERTLAGEGFTLADARPSIELVHQIRQAKVAAGVTGGHPFLQRAGRRD